VFKGSTELNLDGKGRMAIPARYRDRLLDYCAGQLVVTRDYQYPCLLLYPLPHWNEIEQQLASLPTFDKQARSLQRLIVGQAEDIAMDSHGRILLPASLRSVAGLDKRVMLVGQGRKFEIWDADRWNACLEEAEQEAAEQLSAVLQGLTL